MPAASFLAVGFHILDRPAQDDLAGKTERYGQVYDHKRTHESNTDRQSGHWGRQSNSDPVDDEYKNRGCEGDGRADQTLRGSGMRDHPVHRSDDGSGTGTARDQKGDQYSACRRHSF